MKQGYKFKLNFDPSETPDEETNGKDKRRKRSIIWFNPPYSRPVATNVGSQFWEVMDKHFPPGNPLHQIFNRNKVKMSYRCTPNFDRRIKGHNTKILNTVNNQEEMEPRKTCNCRKKDECPSSGK